MTDIKDTAFATLDQQGRLLNAVLKSPTERPGRYGFRGELALKFAQQFADEKRPPEMTADQVIAMANAGEPAIAFIACYLHSFEYLKTLREVLDGLLSPTGKYFLFCNNIDLLSKYTVELDGITFQILPIDESTVYNELLELLYLEKSELKKASTAGKTDKVADAALKFDGKFDPITYEQGLERMGPVRNRNENRPV
ncbi:hypothetical protein [Methylocystis heyeri]|uniref:Uncharacterized protein n=1 Tax=Methylocystis heyeri TaxID=391905 RepID=A0A6B8KJG9_9HYPH|nr:hypothetical protein [Methylocystis heyeri]QGM47777.1 hypothetical protein H2LOC_020020 [Methylocystis heyeri]